MIEGEHAAPGSDEAVEGGFEPVEVFLLDVAVAHLHEGATVYAYDHEGVDYGYESVVAPEVDESFGGALAPCVLVVARENAEGMADLVEDALDVAELGVGSFVGEVAVHHYKVERGGVDVVDGFFELSFAGVAGLDVNVGEDCNSLAPNGGRESQKAAGENVACIHDVVLCCRV